VLDEPTIGLHPRDNAVLLDALAELATHRNTLVVVEHDEDTIRRADHVLDLGPAAGVKGGEVVGAGTVQDLMRNPRLDHRTISACSRCSIRRGRIAP
jgi:excinuclease ABC subunit A